MFNKSIQTKTTERNIIADCIKRLASNPDFKELYDYIFNTYRLYWCKIDTPNREHALIGLNFLEQELTRLFNHNTD